jgi:cytochrome oxidase Cu insertion factor (SCO1/SenC/PrrC family)
MSEQPPSRINPWTVWVPIILIVLGSVVFYNYLTYVQLQQQGESGERPPFIHRAEGDLILTERDGREVRLSELRGKVILAAWVFTRCPRGCAGVVAKMKKLSEEYANRDDIHFIAFALDPEDTPEMLKAFAEQVGIAPAAPWWLVNGDPVKVREYMVRQLKFRPVQNMPEGDRLSPEDKYMHDLRVALIDHQGNVRRLADVVNADPEVADYWDQKLRRELDIVLKEKARDEKLKDR